VTDWLPIPKDAGRPIIRREANEATTEAVAVPIYRKRYLRGPGKVREKAPRYYEEAICEFDPGSSLWVFGSGHPVNCNTIRELSSLGRILATDLVEEAGRGLKSSIAFKVHDILKQDAGVFDYVFSSHTIEHLTRDELMEVVLPRCLRSARKAVVFVAPYSNVGWKNAAMHRVQLDENDELAARALRYKRIGHSGRELVLWFDGEADE
jgi:hypothetical protein